MRLDFSSAVSGAGIPSRAELRTWVSAVLAAEGVHRADVAVRVVDEDEGAGLNRSYRGRDRATNVLSFPFQAPPGLPGAEMEDFLGDLVLCAPVVAREASGQGKPLSGHWAHLVVHGLLHLLGYDHIEPAEAAAMEAREVVILADLGLPDPYLSEAEA